MVAHSNYFSDFEFKLLHKIKSKTSIKQFPKITYITPGILIIKSKPKGAFVLKEKFIKGAIKSIKLNLA
jgi:kynurenine formamidase